MAASIFDFSTTDASNTAFNGISQAENVMKPSDVNNDFRAKDGAFARWLNDLNGTLATTATANTMTITLAQGITAYPTNLFFRCKIGVANTSQTVTLTVNGISAKPVKVMNAIGTLVNPAIGALAVGLIAAFTYDGTNLVLLNPSGSATTRQRRNIDWNPGCEVSQQNGTTLGTTNGFFATDSDAMYFTAATAAMSVQQIATRTLNGSAHQVEWKCTTAKGSLGTGDFVTLTRKIEGLDATELLWGTASAIPATRSFQFSGPQTLHHVHIQNRSGNRHIAIPFTPTAANTEERITVIVPGDTSGTWAADNDTITTIDIVLAAGSTLTGGSASTWSGSTFYAATTQGNDLSSTSNVVRVGDFSFSPDPDSTGVAPAWVPVGFSSALAKCMRYYETSNGSGGQFSTGDPFVVIATATTSFPMYAYKVGKRAASPTLFTQANAGTGATFTGGQAQFYQSGNHSQAANLGWTSSSRLT